MRGISRNLAICCITAIALVVGLACSPTVRVVAPEKPITINLNVKVQQEVRIKVEKDVDKLFLKKADLF